MCRCVYVHMCIHMCVCVCVYAREKRGDESYNNLQGLIKRAREKNTFNPCLIFGALDHTGENTNYIHFVATNLAILLTTEIALRINAEDDT